MHDPNALNRLADKIDAAVKPVILESGRYRLMTRTEQARAIVLLSDAQAELRTLAAQSATPAARAADDDALREFARWAISESSFQGCDLDGSDVQDKAHRLGLLKEVQVSEPCSEIHCACAEAGADFPTTCYRFSELLTPPKTQEPQ